MTVRRFLAFSAAAFLLPLAAPAAARTTGLRAGAAVTDPQGGEVGTIVAIEGANVVLRTDRHEVRLPAASFTATDSAVLFGMTRDQLNASVDQMQAQAQQAFAVGAVVRDRDGAIVGPVQALDAESVTVRVGEGLVRLPRAALAPRPDGLATGATLAELQAAASAAPAE